MSVCYNGKTNEAVFQQLCILYTEIYFKLFKYMETIVNSRLAIQKQEMSSC